MRTLLDRVWQEWKQLETDITDDQRRDRTHRQRRCGCQRLRQIPGVGPLVSTATVAAIGNGAAFRKGRDFAAWLGLVPRSTPPEAKRSYRASVSAETFICDACSSTVHVRCYCGSSPTPVVSASGSISSKREHPATKSSLLSPTSWRGSPGQCCSAEEYQTIGGLLTGVNWPWKRRFAWKALTRFPLSHRHYDREYLTRSAEERTRTKEQSNGVPENLSCKMVLRNRAIYKDWHVRIIIMARRTISN